MSNTQRPDISKIKQKIAGRDIDHEEPIEEAPKPANTGPLMRPETIEQVKQFAKDVQELREQEAQEEVVRTEIEELPEELEGTDATGDNMFYRYTAADNPDVRRAIEERASEMDFADLIITGRVSQHIPIIKDKFEIELQSLLAAENFWIERRAEKEGTTDWALRSWMGYARLALSIVTINGKTMPPCSDNKGVVDEERFAERFSHLMGMGEKPVEYLLVNLTWFNDRVDRLAEHDFEQLKNG
tara:strand:+ start:41774 stop:42502 length:729 start_codon:yes stop_codon:yes gene_type:complete